MNLFTHIERERDCYLHFGGVGKRPNTIALARPQPIRFEENIHKPIS